MSDRTFQFRLRSSHRAPTAGSDGQTDGLVVELLTASGEWQPQQPSLTLPGFRLYLISLLLCQHFHLVSQARETALPLEQVEIDFVVSTSDWTVTRVDSDVRLCLDAAASEPERSHADAGAIASLQERMLRCPVARNLPAGVRQRIAITAMTRALT